MKFFNIQSEAVIANGMKQSLVETASCLPLTFLCLINFQPVWLTNNASSYQNQQYPNKLELDKFQSLSPDMFLYVTFSSQKVTKRQAKNIFHAPRRKLRFLRSLTHKLRSLKSCFLASPLLSSDFWPGQRTREWASGRSWSVIFIDFQTWNYPSQ